MYVCGAIIAGRTQVRRPVRDSAPTYVYMQARPICSSRYYPLCAPVVLEPHPVRDLIRRVGSVARNVIAIPGRPSTGYLVTGNFVFASLPPTSSVPARDATFTLPLTLDKCAHLHATSCKPSVPTQWVSNTTFILNPYCRDPGTL